MSTFTDHEIDLARRDGEAAFNKGLRPESNPFTFPELKTSWGGGWNATKKQHDLERERRRAEAKRLRRENAIGQVLLRLYELGEYFELRQFADAMYPKAVKTRKDGETYNCAMAAAHMALKDHSGAEWDNGNRWKIVIDHLPEDFDD